MKDIKVLIICETKHHGNTLKIAQEMTKVLGADLITHEGFVPDSLNGYDLIGIGSGIYGFSHERNLFDLINKLENQNGKPVFIFSSSTFLFEFYQKPLKEALVQKGFKIIGGFSCKGFMTHSITKYFFGGINKGRPNEKDLENARLFAQDLKNRL
jgi:flavodoxin